MKTQSLKIAWSRFFLPPTVEKDPGFRAVILRQTKYGMAGLGLLGIVSVLLFVTVRYFSVESFGWNYDSRVAGGIILWDKVGIILISAACLVLSRTSFGPRSGRLLVAILVIAASIALLLDDLGTGDLSFSPAYLALLMLGAVGTMPYRPAQILALCLAIIGVYLSFMALQASILGFDWWEVDPTRARFLVVATPICTVISALIYSSRYELYKSRSRAQTLKEEVRSQSRQMLALEREKARVLEASYEKLKALQSQLVHQGKMASLGRLTAGIAHEIRNPLNFVVNYALLSSEQLDDLLEIVSSNYDKRVEDLASELSSTVVDLKHNAHKINTHGMRAAAIVQNMLSHSHATGGERKVVDVNELTEEYVNLAYHAMRAQHPGSDVIIEDQYDTSLVMVELAPQEIGRVIINLLDNAFYATHQKAAVADGDYTPIVSVTTEQARGSVLIRIRDNGLGISEEQTGRIFEPFYTTKPAGSGTGLGLSLSYDIVTQGHGGNLYVENGGGAFTTFVISLPVQSTVRLEEARATHP